MSQMPMAYDVNAVRAAILSTRADLLASAGATPTKDIRDALNTARRHLSARKVKHFAHEGVIVSRRSYADNDAQLRAVDTLLDVYGVKAPRAAAAPSAFGVAIEIDPASGVIRVIAGTKTTQQPGGPA